MVASDEVESGWLVDVSGSTVVIVGLTEVSSGCIVEVSGSAVVVASG